MTSSEPFLRHDITTAPGDIPSAEVAARFAVRLHQFRHDNTIEPLAPGPADAVTVWAVSGVEAPVVAAELYATFDGSAPDSSAQRIPMDLYRVEWDPQGGYLTWWRCQVPPQPAGTAVRYRIGGRLSSEAGGEPDLWAHDGQGFWFKFPGEAGVTTFAYLVEEPGSPMPEWMDDAVIYHIFLDRFHSGTPDGSWHGERGVRTRHGGTLRGVREALPYLQELGVTCLWLSPLHPSETYHRYDGIDFFEVDSDLGTLDELKELVEELHRRGMRIWLDYVPGHCSWRHPAFQMAQQSRDSPTHSWFTFDRWPQSYRSFLGVAKYLPSFNTQDPGARKYLIDAAGFWLRNVGVDGFRLDHAIAPTFDFWVAFRQATEAARPDVVNVGEATDTPDCLRRYRGRLNGILDFPLANALRLAFGKGVWSASTLDSFLSSYERFMADGPGRVSFLDNHDMDRFLWVAGNDTRRLKLAALCQMTLAATPVIYYGTEIGMSQQAGKDDPGSGGDAQARQDMPWQPELWDHELLAFYRSLIQLRRDSKALRRGSRRAIHVDDGDSTFGYLRMSGSGEQQLGDMLALFNLSTASRHILLPEGEWQCALATDEECHLAGQFAELPALTGMALRRE